MKGVPPMLTIDQYLDDVAKNSPPPKIRPVKNFKTSVCIDCGAEIHGLVYTRKRCDSCNAERAKPKEKPRLLLPCPDCGEILDVTRRGKATLCRPCAKARLKKRAAEKLRSDPEYRRKEYDRNNEYYRRVVAPVRYEMTLEERRNLNVIVVDGVRSKKCKVCGSVKPVEKFLHHKKQSMTCYTCQNRKRWDRDKQPDSAYRKRVASKSAIIAERREILSRFDLFAPEREAVKKASKKRSRIKERSTAHGRVNRVISERVRVALKGNKTGWRTSVGWTIRELMQHMEAQFKPGMSWDNYGEWHIDHIKPKAKFEFSSAHDEGFKACWSLSNLQPMWASDNSRKSDKWFDMSPSPFEAYCP